MAIIIQYETTRRQTPEGSFALTFVMSRDWTDRPFASNVFVESKSKTQASLLSLALNEKHDGFRPAVERAKMIDNRLVAIQTIEQMRHALCDYASVPERVHRAVIGNMGMLALAHGIRSVDLSHPDIISKLNPVLDAYDIQTTQRRATMHQTVIQQGRNTIIDEKGALATQ